MPRPFATTRDDIDTPDWAPLERVALLARRSPDLPSFHPGEFMYTARLSARRRPKIHLYKHCDTRRYLNLDDGGHAYAFCGPSPGASARGSGLYLQHRSLADGIDLLELDMFHMDPPLWRSFPPAEWPPDPFRYRVGTNGEHMKYHMVMARRQVLVQLDDDLVERLDRLAVAEGTNRSELLRRGAAAVLAAASEREADKALRAAYRRVPQDPVMVEAARRLAADTAPEW